MSNKLRTIAVDFDGTLCDSKLAPHHPVIDYIIYEKEVNNSFIILWTCRTGELIAEAIDFCARLGIPIDLVNENHPDIIKKFGQDSRKIFADYYIDDKGINPINSNIYALIMETSEDNA